MARVILRARFSYFSPCTHFSLLRDINYLFMKVKAVRAAFLRVYLRGYFSYFEKQRVYVFKTPNSRSFAVEINRQLINAIYCIINCYKLAR